MDSEQQPVSVFGRNNMKWRAGGRKARCLSRLQEHDNNEAGQMMMGTITLA